MAVWDLGNWERIQGWGVKAIGCETQLRFKARSIYSNIYLSFGQPATMAKAYVLVPSSRTCTDKNNGDRVQSPQQTQVQGNLECDNGGFLKTLEAEIGILINVCGKAG